MLINLICFILILGIIVFIHELGHFLWAKKFGVYCYEFSLGFGPKVFSFNRKNDETLYCIRAFPLGGFVSMAGEEIDDDKNVSKEKKLYNKKWYQKIIIVLAGITNNFLLAIFVLFFLSLICGSYTTKPIVGDIDKSSSAYLSGLRKNDNIIKIDGKKISTWDDLSLELTLANKTQYQEFTIKRDNDIKKIKIKAKEIIDSDNNKSYAYGILIDDTLYYGPVNAFKYSVNKFSSLFKSMVVTIKSLFTGKINLKSLSGPVGIYKIVGQQRKTSGLEGLVYLLAYLSINVGFINLLPFPAFDGYRALIILIEKIFNKKISPKVDAIINNIGLMLLFGLMIFITIKDVIGLF